MPFESKFIKEKLSNESIKVPNPNNVDDMERKISNDYANFFDQIKQQRSNDSQKLKKWD